MSFSPISIHEVNTARRREVNRFISLAFRLYRDTPQWVPPLLPDARLQLNRRKNPFYLRNDAAFFIAEREGEDVGRICVMEPRYYNEYKGTAHAHFYLFECIDDPEVADALFNRAADWARARGLQVIRGPLGFMAGDGFGMLAHGFEHRPAVGLPYNFAYYPRLAEGWGFRLEERVYSGYLSLDEVRHSFPPRIIEVAEKVKQRYGFTARMFASKRELVRWAKPRLRELYNRSLTHIAGDPPLTPEELEVVASNLMLIADPRLIKVIVRQDDPDTAVGFLFCFNDISAGIQKARGRIFPLGWWHILRDFRRTEWVNLNGMGMLPEYQGFGGPAVLYAELYENVQRMTRFKHADVVQISEFNAKSLNEMRKFGVDFYKTHHIYRCSLNGQEA